LQDFTELLPFSGSRRLI